VDAGLVWLVAAEERCVSSRATTSTGTPRRISPDVICLVCEPVRGPRPPVWFLAGPVGHQSADRWQPASYRVPAAPRGTDAGRRSAARSPRSAFVLAGGRSQPDLLDERMSVGYPGGGVTTGSEPAPAALPARNRPVKVSCGDGSPGRGPAGSPCRRYRGVDRIFLVQHPVFPEPALLDVLSAWPLAGAGKASTASGGRVQGHSAGGAARAAGGRLTRLDGAPRYDAAAPGRMGDLNPAGLGLG